MSGGTETAAVAGSSWGSIVGPVTVPKHKKREGYGVTTGQPEAELSILIADDDGTNRDALHRALTEAGCRVAAVGDGASAVERAAQSVFDVALVHIDLPILNGAQCREAIAGLPGRHSQVAVIALLPQGSNPAQRPRQLLEGFADVLSLPLEVEGLLARLRDLAPTTDVTPAVDMDHLHRYTLGDTDLEQELFEAFLPSAGRYIEQLSGTLNDGDWSRTAHALKGAARGIGAFDLGELAARAEAEPPADSARSAMIADLRTALRAVERFIADRMQRPSS